MSGQVDVIRAAKVATAAPEGPRDIYCPAPGCATMIRRDSRTGVCRAHVHLAGVCRCSQCRAAGRASADATAPNV